MQKYGFTLRVEMDLILKENKYEFNYTGWFISNWFYYVS